MEEKGGSLLQLSETALGRLRHTVRVGSLEFEAYRAGMSESGLDEAAALYHSRPDFGYCLSDAILSAIMRRDWRDLKVNARIGLLTIGWKNNPITGEEYGKPIHQRPGVPNRKGDICYYTTYDRCDSAFFIVIALHHLMMDANDVSLLEEFSHEIRAMIEYVLKHMDAEGIFWDGPEFCGDVAGKRLRVSVWCDSGLVGRPGGVPYFPVAYLIAQTMCVRFWRDLRDFPKIIKLGYTADQIQLHEHRAKEALWEHFWNPDRRMLAFAIDGGGKYRVEGVFADLLSCLAHLEPEDVSPSILAALLEVTSELVKPFGIHRSPNADPYGEDHSEAYQLGLKYWVPDQFWGNETGHRFDIPGLFAPTINFVVPIQELGFREFFRGDPMTGEMKVAGMPIQLWTASYPFYIADRHGIVL